ncbi:MAG: 6,7-dimethyl-8-ribityllumazine synthase, partial [Alphaproteobacteria bacterium]
MAAKKPVRVLIVEARFYEAIADEMANGAIATLREHGAAFERLAVPGAFEIPGAIKLALDKFDGFVALGCVMRGETTHYDYVCGESARGLQDLAVHYDACLGYGILTTETEDQAWARARIGEGNKGRDAALACL